jgi:predicted dinucleotide-binding enzyme
LAQIPTRLAVNVCCFSPATTVTAKSEVIALFEDAGFFVVDLGDLRTGGGMQQVGGPLSGVNLVRLPEPN